MMWYDNAKKSFTAPAYLTLYILPLFDVIHHTEDEFINAENQYTEEKKFSSSVIVGLRDSK